MPLVLKHFPFGLAEPQPPAAGGQRGKGHDVHLFGYAVLDFGGPADVCPARTDQRAEEVGMLAAGEALVDLRAGENDAVPVDYDRVARPPEGQWRDQLRQGILPQVDDASQRTNARARSVLQGYQHDDSGIALGRKVQETGNDGATAQRRLHDGIREDDPAVALGPYGPTDRVQHEEPAREQPRPRGRRFQQCPGLRGGSGSEVPGNGGGKTFQSGHSDAETLIEVRRLHPGQHQPLFEDPVGALGDDRQPDEGRREQREAQSAGDEDHDPALERQPRQDGHAGPPSRDRPGRNPPPGIGCLDFILLRNYGPSGVGPISGGSSADHAILGRAITKRAPRPSWFSTMMIPPCASTSRLAMARPSPAPPRALLRALSTL